MYIMRNYLPGNVSLNFSNLLASPSSRTKSLEDNIVSGEGLIIDFPVLFMTPTMIISNSSLIWDFFILIPSYFVSPSKEISSKTR